MNRENRILYNDRQRYDLVMGQYATGSQLGFYHRQIARYGAPALEIACGTGRLTIPLAEAGVEIMGVDISEHMLQHAKTKAAERGVDIAFVQADMRAFDLGKRFGFIFIPAQSLSHLHTRAEIEACFKCVRQHLMETGKFLIELFNPSFKLLSREQGIHHLVGEYEDQQTNERIILTEEVSYDAATQINHILWYFQNAMTREEQVLSFEMRQFFPQEIETLLAYNGFRVEQKWGDYSETEFVSDSPKQLIVCCAN